jgi:GT2 family glycosyltransferase
LTLHVTVAIVGYRNPVDIAQCVAALAKSTYADFDVIICENGGPTAYQALANTLPLSLPGGQRVRSVCAPRNLGFAGGVNLCLAETPASDAWWVLNPDTEPCPEALAAQVERLAEGDCDAVGATLYLPDGRVQSHGGRWRSWLARAESIGVGDSMDIPVDAARIERQQSYLNGASMLITRRFLELVGPMREDYFLYCEEVEWFLRAGRMGMRLGFAPKALVLHKQGSTTGAGARHRERPRLPIYLGERNKILLTRDCFPGRLPVAAAAALVLVSMRYVRHRAWPQWGYALAGWQAGLRGERGPPP